MKANVLLWFPLVTAFYDTLLDKLLFIQRLCFCGFGNECSFNKGSFLSRVFQGQM